MLQYPETIPIDLMLCYMAWRYVKNLNQIWHIWNLWLKGFQTVYRLSKSVDILEEALKKLLGWIYLKHIILHVLGFRNMINSDYLLGFIPPTPQYVGT